MKTLRVIIAALVFLPPLATAQQQAGPPPAKVVLAPIREEMVAENTPIIGVLYYDRVSSLSTEVGGLVNSAPFREGDRVKEGDVLVTLNTDFIERDIELAQTKIEQVSVQIERTDKNLARIEALFKQQAVAEKRYDDICFERRDLIKQREALAKRLEISRLKWTKSVIRAPFQGVVLSKNAEVGNWVDRGDELCRIGCSDDLYVKVPVAEKLLPYSPEGQTVEVIINAFNMKLQGAIAGTMPVADPRTKNVMLKISLPRMEALVKNMSATVLISTSEPRRLKLVPRDALVNFEGRDVVYTVTNHRAVPLPIRVVAYVGEFAGIEKPDLPDGVMVVVDGNQRLRPDQPVEIIEAGSDEGPRRSTAY